LGCSCTANPRPLDEVIKATGRVFVAKVTEINWSVMAMLDYPIMEKNASWNLSRSRVKVVTLDVQEPFKGIDKGSTTILSESSSAACGVDFVVGSIYLIYANRRSTSCSYISRLSYYSTEHFEPDIARELKEINSKITVGMLFEMDSINKVLPSFDVNYCSRTREISTKEAQQDLSFLRTANKSIFSISEN
jgi:hypothetical protein